jgi:hypothetical protein
MWSWARLGGAGRPNSGEPPPGLAGEGQGGDLGGTRVRFGHWFGGERRPAVAVGGAPRRQPLGSPLRRGPGR